MAYGTETYLTGGATVGQGSAGVGNDGTSTPAWRQYYEYAEQLYAAGYREQAEPYYLYSRQLYAAAQEASAQPAARVEYARYSYAPQSDAMYGGQNASVAPQQPQQAEYAYAPQSGGMYSGQSGPAPSPQPQQPQQAEYAAYAYMPRSEGMHSGQSASAQCRPDYASQAPVSLSDALYGGQGDVLQSQQAEYRRDSYMPLSEQPMTSVPATLSAPPSWSLEPEDEYAFRPKRSLKRRVKFWIVTSLILTLFLVVGGFVGLFTLYKDRQSSGVEDSSFIAEWTVNPLMDGLAPALDKTDRMISAAGPLLFELGLRDTLPEEFSVKDDSSPPASDDARSAQPVAPSTAPSLDNSTVASPGGAEGATDKASAEDAADEGPDEALKERADEEPSSPAVAVHSNSEHASDRKVSRSHRTASEASDDNLIEEIPVDDSRVAPPTPSAPVSSPPPAPPRNSKTRELDDLLAPEPAHAPRAAETAPDKPAVTLRQQLSREEVQQGMSRVGPTVKRCGQGSGGTIFVSVKIGANGRVDRAVATGAFAGTPVGNCAERAVRQARFPSAQDSLTVKYPFGL